MDTDTTAPNDIFDLRPACDRVALLLAGVDDGRLDGPTPCTDYAVRDLLGHFLGLTTGLGATARKDLGPLTGGNPGAALPELTTGWRDDLARQLGELAEAWRVPDAWQGSTQAGGVDLPGRIAGLVALNEVVVHGWDLARSTGQEYEQDEESLRGSFAMLQPFAEAGPEGRGPFGPAVAVPADAPLLDRVVGMSGRSPDWRPER